MIECPVCGRQYRSGALFCSECGVYLATGGPLRTEPLPEGELPTSLADPWAVSTREGQEIAKPTVVCINMPDSGRQVQLPVAPEIQLGRLDTARGVFPDLDLTPDGGLNGGVSRHHAKIRHQDGLFFIEDLGSANGTFLNGERLTPYLPHPLQSGDELQIGKLKLIVEFGYSSP